MKKTQFTCSFLNVSRTELKLNLPLFIFLSTISCGQFLRKNQDFMLVVYLSNSISNEFARL